MMKDGENNSTILAHLLSSGADDATVGAIADKLQTMRYRLRRQRGVKLLIAGAVVLLIGFILTFIFTSTNHSFQYVMYATTSVGIGLLLWGIVDVLGF